MSGCCACTVDVHTVTIIRRSTSATVRSASQQPYYRRSLREAGSAKTSPPNEDAPRPLIIPRLCATREHCQQAYPLMIVWYSLDE